MSIVLPSLYVMAALLAAGCLAVLWGARSGRVVRTASGVIVGYLVLSLVFTGIIPSLYQRLVVQPNELAKEAPQYAHHIAATRKAWGLEAVERRELEQLASSPRATSRPTGPRSTTCGCWTAPRCSRTSASCSPSRTYYEFIAVDDDRYQVNGSLRHVLLSARELDVASLPTRALPWTSLLHTHRDVRGSTIGPTNEITPEGLPVLWVQDLPPTTSIDRDVTRPQIYFRGRSRAPSPSRRPVSESTIRPPKGTRGSTQPTPSAAGVPIGSLMRKALFALRFQSLNILLSGDLTDKHARAVLRNVRERAQGAPRSCGSSPRPVPRRDRQRAASGCSMPTRPPTVTRTRRAWAMAPTTCATA